MRFLLNDLRQPASRKPLSHRLLTTTACALALLAGASASPVLAQGAAVTAANTRTFNIQAQPLAAALNAFGRQSGLQVSLAAETARGMTSKPVSGTYTADAALSQLLAGSGISYRISNGVVVVGNAAPGVSGAAGTDGATVIGEITIAARGGRPSSVSSVNIGAEALAERNPANISDVFRGEASVTVGSSLPTSQKVYVHGVEETNLAVSIDGSRQNNRVFHHNATNLIDPSLLKAVDVDAGIAPADAGPGALGGSIAYETKDARDLLSGDGFGGFVSESWNSNSNTFTTGLSAYGMKDGFEFLGFLNYGKGSNFEAGNGDEVPGTETNLLSGLGKIAYEADSGDRFELSHEQVRDDAIRPYRANAGNITTGRAWEPSTRNYLIERRNTVFTYTDTTPEGWWDPTAMLAYSHSSVETPAYFARGNYLVTGEAGSFNGKFENKFSFDIGSVTAGVDFYSDKIDLDTHSEHLGFNDDAREKARNIGLYAQARLQPVEQARLSFGGRYDTQWFTGTTDREWKHSGLSGNISGEYDLTDIFTVKAGASRVWAGIPLAESYIMNPVWNYGADGPEVTTSTNLMAGIAAKYEGFTAEASLFRTDIADARVAKYAAASANLNYDLVSKGFEIGAGYDWVDGYIKVKYAHIDVTVNGQPADSDTGNYLSTPVGDIFTITAAHTFTDWGLTLGGDIEIAPEYDKVIAGSAPYRAYEVVNVYAEYKPVNHPNLLFRAEVQNLFNETYANRATYGQEFDNVKPLYEQGRAFLLTVKATF